MSGGEKSEQELEREAFRARREQVESWSEPEQFAFAVALALHWKTFLAAHESPSHFGRLPRPKQMDYFKKMIAESERHAAERDLENLFPMELLIIYLASIIEGDRELERDAGVFLDAYTRRGWTVI